MTRADPDSLARAEAVDFCRRLVPHLTAELGTELLGVYLLGSLAHGGFSRRYSDVDVALITKAGLPPQALDRVQNRAIALSADWGPKLSVFWTDRHFSLGRFPPLDRIDYLDRAVMIAERERSQPARPTLKEIRGYLSGAPLASFAQRVRRFAAAQTLDPQDRKAYLKALLYPARFCYGWMSGRMGSNDEAVAFLVEARPAALDVDLITRALECRRSAADPDSLFPARTKLPAQVDACAALLENT
jgi:predicted nucleotidyltransferase